MDKRRGKILGIVVLLIAFFIVSFNSIYKTSLVISDSDSTTYIIVVMLMIFAFILFFAKEDLSIEHKRRDIIIGAFIFLGYIILTGYLRSTLSFLFETYRIDALLFPLILLSFIWIIFGFDGIKKMKYLIIFSLFASPLILLPVISLNVHFANINASLVQGIVSRLFGINIVKNGFTLLAPSGSSISISTACVPLGAFIALVMLLIPVGYLYNGRLKNKIAWIGSALVLMLLLNLLRMSIVAIAWAHGGITVAIEIFHSFAGMLIFYALIAVMILVTSKYGMELPSYSINNKKRVSKRSISQREYITPLIAVLLLAIIGFGMTLPYKTATYAPWADFARNVSIGPSSLFTLISDNAKLAGISVVPSGYLGSFQIVSLDGKNGSVALIESSNSPIISKIPINYTKAWNIKSFILKKGISVKSEIIQEKNSTFDVNILSIPYNLTDGKGWITLDYAIFRYTNSTSNAINPEYCKITIESIGIQNYIESVISNIIRGNFGSNSSIMCDSYKFAAVS